MTKFSLIFLLFSFALQTYSQNRRVAGFVYDIESREKLIGASVTELRANNGVSTNNNGFFSLQITSDSIRISFIGYTPMFLNIPKDTIIEIFLKSGELLDEVNIVKYRFRKANVTSMSSSELLSMPSITGKPDIIKALQLTPGIESQAEGKSILSVRGGTPGENLYMIDDVPLIYVNHIGGFISVFNPDMINNIEVYKSNFPAKYGGKLSSVLSITQREGDKQMWKGNLGIGITDMSFTIEGPLIRDKLSLIINGRKTLIDPIMAFITLTQNDDYFIYYGFHDINAKLSYRPSLKNSFHLNFYTGDDYLVYNLLPKEKNDDRMRYTNRWGNHLISGKWSRIIKDKFFVNNTLSVTKYRLKVKNIYIDGRNKDEELHLMLQSYVQDASLRSDWSYHLLNGLTFNFGCNFSFLTNLPNNVVVSKKAAEPIKPFNAFEASFYKNSSIDVTPNFHIDLGVRYVNFIKDEFNVKKIEPRIVLRYIISNQQLSLSYQDVNQFSHLLFTSGAIFNNEVWITADNDLPPSQSRQYCMGWNSDLINGKFSAELNLYQKYAYNLTTYKEGYTTLLGDGNWKSKVETGGSGNSKGVELLIKKNTGILNGFIAYTYSQTKKRFPVLNSGNEFISDFDRPHSLSAVVNHKINEMFELSMVWVCQTGLPYTPVMARHLTYIEKEEIEVLVYGDKNSERMNVYHRLDAAFKYKKSGKRGRKVEWIFSVHNLYNRKNPNSYFYSYAKNYYLLSQLQEKTQLKQYQNSFFPIIPMISYKVSFDNIKLLNKVLIR